MISEMNRSIRFDLMKGEKGGEEEKQTSREFDRSNFWTCSARETALALRSKSCLLFAAEMLARAFAVAVSTIRRMKVEKRRGKRKMNKRLGEPGSEGGVVGVKETITVTDC